MLLISDENYLMVKEILNEAKKSHPENTILFDDLQKQEIDFQKKLQEKRSVKLGVTWKTKNETSEVIFIFI